MNLRFRHKLLLAFALLLVVTLLPVLVLVNTQIERISAEKITDDLVNTRRVFRRFQQNQISGYSERTSAFILTQPEVRAEIATLSEQGGLFADAATGGPPPVGSKAIPQLSAASPNKPVRRAGAKAGSDPFGAASEQGGGSAEGKGGSDPFGAASEQGAGSAEGKGGSDPYGAASEQGGGSPG
ncbi:MAG: hypothetical protein HY342_09345, partial [Candidatus Lambdaproteobacteria bacterium]|nr:hypothetical protein [Candidatus Lambdaproteobacteria bacterium]